MKKNAGKILSQIVKLSLSVGIIVWLVKSDKLDFSSLKSFLQPKFFALGLILILINNLLVSERWRLLLKSQKAELTRWQAFKLSQIGLFFNFAMPGGVGGDVVKAYYFNKLSKTQDNRFNPRVVALTSVLMDRVIGLYAMVIMAFVAMLLDLRHVLATETLTHLFYFISLLSLGFTVGLALVFSSWIYDKKFLTQLLDFLPFSEKLQKIYESLHLYGKYGFTFFSTLVMSFFAQSASITFLFLAGTITGIFELTLTTYFLIAPLGFMATAIPISPAGVGIGQAAFYFLFNLYTQQETELGPTVITSFQVFSFLTSILGAFFYLRIKDGRKLSDLETDNLNTP